MTTLLDDFRALTRRQDFKTSSDIFVEAVGLIRDLKNDGCDQELIRLHAEFEQFAGVAANSSPSVEILRGLLYELVKDIKLSSQAGNANLVPLASIHSSVPVQTLHINGQSFQVRKGTQLPVSGANRNTFSRIYSGSYTKRGGKAVSSNENIRYFLTINYGVGVQFVGLAKQRTNAKKTSEIDHFAFTSFETTDANWAAMFTEFQAVLNGAGEIELPPKFYDKLVSEGKIV